MLVTDKQRDPMTSRTRPMDTTQNPALYYTRLATLAKTLIVTEIALLSVLASVLTGFPSVLLIKQKAVRAWEYALAFLVHRTSKVFAI